MPHIENLEKMKVEELLSRMNAETGRSPDSGPFRVAETAIQFRSISALTKAIDQLRESSDNASTSIKNWTMVLAGATILLAIATIVLWFK